MVMLPCVNGCVNKVQIINCPTKLPVNETILDEHELIKNKYPNLYLWVDHAFLREDKEILDCK